MQKAGRKGAADLAVVAGRTIDGRPPAPKELTLAQRKIWDATVAAEPVEFFRTAATRDLLKSYCRAIATAEIVSAAIDDALKAGSDTSSKELKELCKLRDSETRLSLTVATKLRITNQSRYDAKVAGTASNRAGATVEEVRKPWHAVG